MAGVLAIDPSPFTFRQLSTMYMANQRAAWDQVAALLATQCSVDVSRLNPYRKVKKYGSSQIESEYRYLKRREKIREQRARNG